MKMEIYKKKKRSHSGRSNLRIYAKPVFVLANFHIFCLPLMSIVEEMGVHQIVDVPWFDSHLGTPFSN